MTVMDWLLDSDPAIRWQVLENLVHAPADVVAAERAKVATEGWGARLLAERDPDGQWAGGAHFPKDGFDWSSGEPQPWVSTSHSLALLRIFGLDPASPIARETTELIRQNCKWEYDNLPYWEIGRAHV